MIFLLMTQLFGKRQKFKEAFCAVSDRRFLVLWMRKAGGELSPHLLCMHTFGSKASFLTSLNHYRVRGGPLCETRGTENFKD